jgi:hypothetical protein
VPVKGDAARDRPVARARSTLIRVHITRRRRRRHEQPPPVEQPEVIVGAHSPGVRSRRQLTRREHDLNARLRESIEARRGFPRGPTFWAP